MRPDERKFMAQRMAMRGKKEDPVENIVKMRGLGPDDPIDLEEFGYEYRPPVVASQPSLLQRIFFPAGAATAQASQSGASSKSQSLLDRAMMAAIMWGWDPENDVPSLRRMKDLQTKNRAAGTGQGAP